MISICHLNVRAPRCLNRWPFPLPIWSRARKGSQTHPLLHPSQLLLVEGILLVQVGLFRLQLLRLRAHTHAKNVMGEVAREPVKTKSSLFQCFGWIFKSRPYSLIGNDNIMCSWQWTQKNFFLNVIYRLEFEREIGMLAFDWLNAGFFSKRDSEQKARHDEFQLTCKKKRQKSRICGIRRRSVRFRRKGTPKHLWRFQGLRWNVLYAIDDKNSSGGEKKNNPLL